MLLTRAEHCAPQKHSSIYIFDEVIPLKWSFHSMTLKMMPFYFKWKNNEKEKAEKKIKTLAFLIKLLQDLSVWHDNFNPLPLENFLQWNR